MIGMILLGILAAFGVSVLVAGVKIIGQAEVMVIERLGRFHRVGRSGKRPLYPGPPCWPLRFLSVEGLPANRTPVKHQRRNSCAKNLNIRNWSSKRLPKRIFFPWPKEPGASPP